MLQTANRISMPATMPLLVFLLVLLYLDTANAASCIAFVPTSLDNFGNVTTFREDGPNITVSRGLACLDTNNCSLISQAVVQAERNLNVTTDTDSENSIFSLIQKAANFASSKSVTTDAGGARYVLSKGMSGHIVWQAVQDCVSGRLTGCPQNTGLSETTNVQACTPVVEGQCKTTLGHACVAASFSLASTTAEEAASTNCTACDAYEKASPAVRLEMHELSALISTLWLCLSFAL